MLAQRGELLTRHVDPTLASSGLSRLTRHRVRRVHSSGERNHRTHEGVEDVVRVDRRMTKIRRHREPRVTLLFDLAHDPLAFGPLTFARTLCSPTLVAHTAASEQSPRAQRCGRVGLDESTAAIARFEAPPALRPRRLQPRAAHG